MGAYCIELQGCSRRRCETDRATTVPLCCRYRCWTQLDTGGLRSSGNIRECESRSTHSQSCECFKAQITHDWSRVPMDGHGRICMPPFVVVRRLAADVIIGCRFLDDHTESLQIRRKVLILADGTVIPIRRRAARKLWSIR